MLFRSRQSFLSARVWKSVLQDEHRNKKCKSMLGQNIQFSSQRCLQCSEYFCFQERKTNQKKMLEFVSKFVTSTFSVLTTFSDLLFPSEKLSSAPQLLGRANMRLSQLHNKTKQTMWLGLKNKKLRSPISHRQIIIWVVSSLVFMGCSDLYLDIDCHNFWSTNVVI